MNYYKKQPLQVYENTDYGYLENGNKKLQYYLITGDINATTDTIIFRQYK